MSSRQDYINAVKSSFISLSKKTIMASIGSGIPFLVVPPLSYITERLVEWMLTKAVNGAETGIFFVYVDFRVASQNKDFMEAAYRNYQAQQNGTQKEKEDAEKDLIKKFDTFVKLNRI